MFAAQKVVTSHVLTRKTGLLLALAVTLASTALTAEAVAAERMPLSEVRKGM